MESHNHSATDPSLSFSIPGVDQDQGIQSGYGTAPTQQPQVSGVTDWALQNACKEELSKGVYPKFYIKATENKAKSREAGRPIFEDKEWVYITIRGDRNTNMDRPVSDQDRSRWPALYAAFKQGQKLSEIGTPLEHWPMVTRSDVENLKHYNVYTVEDLAELDDQAIQNIGIGARDMMNKAKAFMDAAADAAAPQRMAGEIDQLKKQVESLMRNNQELGAAADNAVKTQEELAQLKVALQEVTTRLSDAEMRASAAETQAGNVSMQLADEKNAHKATKRKLTMANKQVETMSEDGLATK